MELRTDLKALGSLVAEALKPHGWGSVDAASLVVKEHSGGMGDSSTKEDVDALLVDTCLAACGHHFGIVGEHSVFGRGPEAIPKVKDFKKLMSELQASDAEQTRFHELGPEGWFAMQGYAKLIKSESSEGVIDAFRFFSRIVESEPADAAASRTMPPSSL